MRPAEPGPVPTVAGRMFHAFRLWIGRALA
jgi:hypothetical protein